jgi:hypothetical protein
MRIISKQLEGEELTMIYLLTCSTTCGVSRIYDYLGPYMESVQRGQYSQDKSHTVSPSRIKRLLSDQQLAKVYREIHAC